MGVTHSEPAPLPFLSDTHLVMGHFGIQKFRFHIQSRWRIRIGLGDTNGVVCWLHYNQGLISLRLYSSENMNKNKIGMGRNHEKDMICIS